MITQQHATMVGQDEFRRALARLEELLIFAAIPRALAFELTLVERVALVRDAEEFFACGYDKEYPTIGRTLVLLIEAIKQV